jgi:branched-chain amino acid aminotransferase
MPTLAKAVGNYINSALAKVEAKQNSYDEAILLDHRGLVSEGTGENIFLVRRGILRTPPLSSSILEGITRATIITLADDLDLKVVEDDVTRAELYTCDEAFLTGTAAEVAPILSIDGRTIGNGGMGEITLRLREAFEKVIRNEDDRYRSWLTPVY